MYVLTIIVTAVNILLWLLYKKHVNRYKLIAQEWRESAEALQDEITTRRTYLAEEIAEINSKLKNNKQGLEKISKQVG